MGIPMNRSSRTSAGELMSQAVRASLRIADERRVGGRDVATMAQEAL